MTTVVEDNVSRKLGSPSLVAVPTPMKPAQQLNGKEAKYWIARKSLRIWPVPGPDRVKNLLVFLRDRL